MADSKSRMLFVNLAVRDLNASIAFFTKLGFSFDPKFTDDKATCMIVSEQAFFMLMVPDRFRDFARKDLCDSHTHTGGIFAVSAASRQEVDAIADAALSAGGEPAADPQDHGFMYVRSFFDLDGHHWEVMWMDPSALASR